MFRQVFNPDNLFWRLISRGVDFVGLGLLWAALCLPIVTIGPATAALYYTGVKVFRQKEDGAFGIMLRAFRDNLKNGVLATLICLPVAALLVYGYLIMLSNATSQAGVVMYVAYYVVLILPVGLVLYLFPLMGRFQLGLKALFKTAWQLTICHLPSTVILVLLNVQLITFTLEKWSPIFVTPMLGVLLSSLFLERAFMKHMTVEERAELQNKTVEQVLEEEKPPWKRKEIKTKKTEETEE